jgi:hypothetical protein
MRIIQLYFWLEISDAIGRLYKTYDEAYEASRMQRSEFEPTSMQVVTLDRTALNKIAETKAEIARLETYLASVAAELDEDKEQFLRESVDILAAAPEAQNDPYMVLRDTCTEEIRAASEQYLDKWFKTRTTLSGKQADFAVENSKHDAMVAQADALAAVLKRIRNIQRIYFGIEIAAPVVFAIFCIFYVRFG